MKPALLTVCLALPVAWITPPRLSADPPAAFVALPENSNTVGILRGNDSYLSVALGGWGPSWQWLGFSGGIDESAAGSRLRSAATVRASGAKIAFDARVRRSGPRRLQLEIELRSDKDTDLTYIMAAVECAKAAFRSGEVVVRRKDETVETIALPLGRRSLGTDIEQLMLVDPAGRKTTISISPPCDVECDGALRIVLARRQLAAADVRRVTLTVDLPEPVTYHAGPESSPDEPGSDAWYEFRPHQDAADGDAPSEIGLESWLDAPAGQRGRIARRGDDLVYGGEPIKLWGLNVCYSSCAPDKDLAERRAAFYAKFGINSVRLHKYADGPGWAGIQSKDSFVELDPDGLDRMDYFVAQLKKRGIYVLLSSTFGVKLGPKDSRHVPYAKEFGAGRTRVSTGHGSVFLGRELQDLQIRQVVALLEHENRYTGMKYAGDPAVAVVELFNEDSALFFGTLTKLQKIPTLRRRASELFCAWLEKRYGGEEGLIAAWGKGALNSFANEGFTDESWGDRTIAPVGNPWFYDPDQLAGSQRPKRRRLLDTMLFLYEIQNEFYARYVDAIRRTGYDGEILASNWQAGRAMSHYYNLHSDSLVGLVDRHNYFGGGGGGRIENATMLRVAGSGMLSAGMQQVADRPFMLSEWIHVAPNEWGVEGPAIIGAYGMGLQGWDASYMFQNRDKGRFAAEIGRDRWEVTTPHVLGVFPAVSRQVLRDDVRESDVVATRYVHVPSLADGKLGFDERVTQQHDVKTFDGDKVASRALAVTRTVVEFTDSYRDTPAFDIGAHRRGDAYASSTGELRWREGKSKLDGFFTIDAAATKAVVGFARGETCVLGDVTISPQCRFGAIYVTAQDKDATIASAKKLLVVAVARSRNTGMKVLGDSRLLRRGSSPVRMEPVRATIALRKRGRPTVHVLDHDGRRTGKTLGARDGAFEIDGARDKTCYYLIEYPRAVN